MRLARHAIAIALAMTMAAPAARAQHVFEVSGGGSSLYDAYGASANFWGPRYDGWFGLGYRDGIRLGAFTRLFVFGDTLRLGNDVLTVRLPTDMFTPSPNILVQGAGYAYGRGQTRVRTFLGASAIGLTSPYFSASRGSQPMAAVQVADSVFGRYAVSATAIGAAKQSLFGGVRYAREDSVKIAATAGLGANKPYLAATTSVVRRLVTVRAAYVYRTPGFRRAEVSTPNQAETERENVEVVFHPSDRFSFGVERKHYVQDSLDSAVPKRSVGNAAFALGRMRGFRLNSGVYFSEFEGTRSVNSYASVGRRLLPWLETDAFYLRSDASGLPTNATVIVQLRERVSQRLNLMQQISRQGGSTRVNLGGGFLTSIAEFRADYQVYYLPLQTGSPFRTVLSLNARVQLGQYATNIGTTILPDGTIGYSAMGSTFLYYGEGGSAGLAPIRIQFDRFMVRGQVVDEGGAPVEGAAISIGNDMVFTDSRGEFFLRTGNLRELPLVVQLDEFLLAGYWSVVTAPARVQPAREEEARPIRIVLRREQNRDQAEP